MSVRRIVGLALIVIGIVTLAWGGVFWTDKDTLVDAGPIQIASEEREGFALPPVVGIIALVGGIVMMVVPDRRRA
jgi:uncharacterized membrane protein YidH (DUF202 family)